MTSSRSRLSIRPVPLHPLLFAAFPVLFLFSANLEDAVSFEDVIVPLLAVLGATTVVLLLATIMYRSLQKAALLVSMWVLLVFSYGHVRNALSGVRLASLNLGGDTVLLSVWAVAAVAAVVVAARSGLRLPGMTRTLNAVAASLVLLNVVIIAVASLRAPDVELARGAGVTLSPPERPRDIYYIVMDRYANEETLRDRYGFDNRPFLDDLRRRGFYVADHSVANHLKSLHSLASSLNMRYLTFLADEVGRSSSYAGPLRELVERFEVGRVLKSAGYRYVHLGSWWGVTRENPMADVTGDSQTWSEFSQVLYDTTVLSTWEGSVPGLPEGADRRQQARALGLSQFDQLARVPELRGPTFTFAHILLPHGPYVFKARGGLLSAEEAKTRTFREKFVGHVRFANLKLTDLFDTLLSVPEDEQPIIVLQADEGPYPARYRKDVDAFDWREATTAELKEKLGILNAYYLPGVGYRDLYPGITPVNTFRLVLRHYFGAAIPLLPDRSFVHVDDRHPYDFVEVTERLRR